MNQFGRPSDVGFFRSTPSIFRSTAHMGTDPAVFLGGNTDQMGTSGRQSKDPSKSVGEGTFRLNTDIAPPSVGKRGAPKVDIGADTHSAIFNSLRPAHWRLKDSLMD